MAAPPIVYILHGDDEYAITEFIAGMTAKMGDPAAAMMNTTHIDGSAFTVETLASATHAMPFLADRRLVVLTDPLGGMKSPVAREKFTTALESIPSTTALVVVINHPLVSEREKRKGVQHWLQVWGATQGGRVFLREFSLPQSFQMVQWIQTKAADLGGAFSNQAAARLAEYTPNDPRTAVHEIEKLLAYVDYSRPVESDDVERLTTCSGEGNVFAMVDAIGNRNGPLAQRMLHQLLEVEDPLRLFGMVVRQFRLLLITRELVDAGHRDTEIASQLKIFPFVARKLIGQVHNFTLETLETIYHKLLEVDEAIKTGQVPGEVALDTLITSLTN